MARSRPIAILVAFAIVLLVGGASWWRTLDRDESEIVGTVGPSDEAAWLDSRSVTPVEPDLGVAEPSSSNPVSSERPIDRDRDELATTPEDHATDRSSPASIDEVPGAILRVEIDPRYEVDELRAQFRTTTSSDRLRVAPIDPIAEFTLEPTPQVVVLSATGYAPRAVSLRPGPGTVHEVRYPEGAVPPATVIEVRDPGGQPVVDAEVHLQTWEFRSLANRALGRTDENGELRTRGLDIPFATLWTSADGFVPRRIEDVRRAVRGDRLRVVLGAGGSLEVSVTDAEGEPVVAGVILRSDSWNRSTHHGTTDREGIVNLTGLGDGRYRLSARVGGQTWPAPAVSITDGEAATARIVIPSQTEVHGRVETNGRPVTVGSVQFRRGDSLHRFDLDDDGTFRGNLASGVRYTVDYRHRDRSSATARSVTTRVWLVPSSSAFDPSARSDEPLEFDFRSASVTIVIEDLNGEPMSDQTVVLRSVEPEGHTARAFGVDGRVTFHRLPWGRYRAEYGGDVSRHEAPDELWVRGEAEFVVRYGARATVVLPDSDVPAVVSVDRVRPDGSVVPIEVVETQPLSVSWPRGEPGWARVSSAGTAPTFFFVDADDNATPTDLRLEEGGKLIMRSTELDDDARCRILPEPMREPVAYWTRERMLLRTPHSLPPGTYRVELRREGETVDSRTITVESGGWTSVRFD